MDEVKAAEFESMGSGDKVRLTLWVDPTIKDELKAQAASCGVSASAYVSVLARERERMDKQRHL